MRARRIRQELEGVACVVCGDSDRWQILGSPRSRLNSVTAIVDCAGCDTRFFLKKVSASGGQAVRDVALDEFHAAQRVYAAYPPSRGYGVVKPFGVIPERGLLFLSYVEGRNASDMLLASSADGKIASLERMGAWLRRFHDSTNPSEGSAGLHERLQWLQARLIDNRPSSPAFGSAMEYLSSEVRKFPTGPSRIIGLHGDCKPENFLVRGAQVVGIDVGWRHRYVAEYDLSQFLAQLALLSRSVRGWRLWPSYKQLEAAFLRGYGVDNPASIRLIEWFKAHYFLSYWLSWRKQDRWRRMYWDAYFTLFVRSFLRGMDHDESMPDC